jgi:plasmid stabilization system protein ParE
VDRAELEQDRWGKLKATSELRAIRTHLGPTAAATTADDLLEQLRTAIRDTPEP